ncbi:MAG: protein translocase subunit SecD [Dehalococcoidia bacterium]
MSRQFRGLIFISVLVALSAAILFIPRLDIGGFARGNEDSVFGLSLGLDLQGGTHLVYRVETEDGEPPTAEDMEGVRRIIESRVNQFGVSEPTVQLLGTPPDRILVQMPGLRGASITAMFSGNTVSQDGFEQFFVEELGREDAAVTQDVRENQLVLIAQLDSLEPPDLDENGNVVTPGDAERYRQAAKEHFPVTMGILFAPEPVEDPDATPTPEPDGTATPEPGPTATPDPEEPEPTATPEPETTVPSIEDVRQVFANIGRDEVEIEELDEGFYQVTLFNLEEAGFDEEGNPIPSEVDRIREGLEEVGDLAGLEPFGRIVQWTPGGGVEEAKALIGSTAQLEFRERVCAPVSPPSPDVEWPPDGLTQDQWAAERCNNPEYYTEQATDIDPDNLEDAFASVNESGQPIVTIVFDNEGADAFFRVTDRISRTGDLLAIYLDGQELVAPRVDPDIGGIAGGRAIISGQDFTPERARTISIQLRSGSLPVSLELLQERSVDALLGETSLRRSLVAGGVGLALLLLFVVSYYKVPGVVAATSLIVYTLMLLAVFKLIPVTLTLAGAAAVILSLGLAVDANILIAERTKEELRSGRGLLAAINHGFSRAWPSIRDGNISTIIVAFVLFWFGDRFGTSIMQGFALTLVVGVLLSMFTAFFVSRVLLRLVAASPIGRRSGLFVPVEDVAAPESAVGSQA